MTSHFTSRDLFRELNGQEFATYRALEREIAERFSSQIESFPGQYSVDRVLELGERLGWIVEFAKGRYRIEFTEKTAKAKRIPA
jgi:hypothetical protein